MKRGVVIVAACVLLAGIGAGACGKKGNPLPPLRPVPARIADLTAARSAGRVELKFTVPSANLDGTTPVVIDRVDIYRLSADADTPPPAAGQLAANQGNLRASLPIRRPPAPGATTPDTTTSTLVPLPGDVATYVDEIAALEQSDGVAALYYVAVPVVGQGRGRSGPPTPVANVSLAALPEPPTALAFANDETAVRVTWNAAAPNHSFRVYTVPAAGAVPQLLTPEPLTTPEMSNPVVFGSEFCVRVSSVLVSGPVVVEGAPSPRACFTPVDRYPPPAPAGMRVVQEGQGVTVIWEAVDAADLAGYVVVRTSGTNNTLVPLMATPIRETTYRDLTVQTGATYTYAVYAADGSVPPNVSATSGRETITVR